LTALALVVGVTCIVTGLDATGAKQVALLAAGALAMFLFFAGIYVTLVRRYYYANRQ